MADLTYYAAKIAECLRLLESSDDPLYRDVYQAMADEFAEKYAALQRRMVAGDTPSAPPSALLHQVAPPPVTPAKVHRAGRATGKSDATSRAGGRAGQADDPVENPPRQGPRLTLPRS